MSADWTAIEYRAYWDVPRAFVLRHGEYAYFFESLFDEKLDDYAPNFAVYRLSAADHSLPADCWREFTSTGVRLRDIPVRVLRFRVESSDDPAACGYRSGKVRFIHNGVFQLLQPV